MNRRMSFRSAVLTGLVVVLGSIVAGVSPAFPQDGATQTGMSSADPLEQIAYDAYLYAYPLVLMDVTMRQMTNVAYTGKIPGRAPVNQFFHARTFPDVEFKSVVRACFDTLYSTAWLDVSEEPVILSVPDTHGRYYLMQLLDMWTDVFDAPGWRTTGTAPGEFGIVGPDWKGKLPEGVVELRAPTPSVWIIGRTKTIGTADYEAVHEIQAGLRLTPLSRWGKPHKPAEAAPPVDPGVDMVTAPMLQVAAMDGWTFFSRFSELLKKHPPHANDYPILHRMSAIGIEPGSDFAPPAGLDPAVLDGAAAAALAHMIERQANVARIVKTGWSMATENMGAYGTSYLRRAVIALTGLGANLPEDAVYPSAFMDSNGQRLVGTDDYVLHFDQPPPVDGFWSLTMYDDKGFPVRNALERYAIADTGLQKNADGSIDIYLGHMSPGTGLESNWLPAPDGVFTLLLRLYGPRREVLEGQWVPPALVKR